MMNSTVPAAHINGRLIKPRPLRSVSTPTAPANNYAIVHGDILDHVTTTSVSNNELDTIQRHIQLLISTLELQPGSLSTLTDLCRMIYVHGRALDNLNTDILNLAIARLKRTVFHPSPNCILPKSLQTDIMELMELRNKHWLAASPAMGKFMERYSQQVSQDSVLSAETSSVSDSDGKSTASERETTGGGLEDKNKAFVLYVNIRAAKINKLFTIDGVRVHSIETITSTKLELSPTLPEDDPSMRKIKVTGTSQSSLQDARILIQRVASAANAIHIRSILGKACQGEITAPAAATRRPVSNPAIAPRETKEMTDAGSQVDSTEIINAESQTDVDTGHELSITTPRGVLKITCHQKALFQEAVDVLQMYFNKSSPEAQSHDHGAGGDMTPRRPIMRSISNDAFIRVSAVRKSRPEKHRYSREFLVNMADKHLCHVQPHWPSLPDDIFFNVCCPPNVEFFSPNRVPDMGNVHWVRQMNVPQIARHPDNPHPTYQSSWSMDNKYTPPKGGGFGQARSRSEYGTDGHTLGGINAKGNGVDAYKNRTPWRRHSDKDYALIGEEKYNKLVEEMGESNVDHGYSGDYGADVLRYNYCRSKSADSGVEWTDGAERHAMETYPGCVTQSPEEVTQVTTPDTRSTAVAPRGVAMTSDAGDSSVATTIANLDDRVASEVKTRFYNIRAAKHAGGLRDPGQSNHPARQSPPLSQVFELQSASYIGRSRTITISPPLSLLCLPSPPLDSVAVTTREESEPLSADSVASQALNESDYNECWSD